MTILRTISFPELGSNRRQDWVHYESVCEVPVKDDRKIFVAINYGWHRCRSGWPIVEKCVVSHKEYKSYTYAPETYMCANKTLSKEWFSSGDNYNCSTIDSMYELRHQNFPILTMIKIPGPNKPQFVKKMGKKEYLSTLNIQIFKHFSQRGDLLPFVLTMQTMQKAHRFCYSRTKVIEMHPAGGSKKIK
uniref:Uncharacterized protein n=1 Tax=Romanomermis culicivorax TaxID=13658 RepID=A0A915LA62_ROMCU